MTDLLPVSNFEWTGELELGHAEIDEQHKKLFLLVQAAVVPPVDPAECNPGAARLEALIEFAIKHFAFEEVLMLSAGYPGAEWHAKIHAALLEELRTYRYKVWEGENTSAVGMRIFLWKWLNLHVDSEDREFVVWLKSRPGA